MQVKIVVIDFEIPARIKRRALTIGIPLAILAGAGAVAYAGVPNIWKSGDVLNAAALNENFDSIDKRVGALEANPTYLVAESQITENGSLSQDLVYQSISLDLTPGTWFVEGFASLSSTFQEDAVQISLWDDTNSVEVPQSRSPMQNTMQFGGATFCDGMTTFCSPVAAKTSCVITVTSGTKIRLKGHRNGLSKLWFGSSDPNGAIVLPRGHRLTALRLK
jgi:hypothetical protein